MTKAQEMLAKAGFPDTKQGRAAFHKMYPTPDHFFKVHGNIFEDFPELVPMKLPIKPENVLLDYSPEREYYLQDTPIDTSEEEDSTDMYKYGSNVDCPCPPSCDCASYIPVRNPDSLILTKPILKKEDKQSLEDGLKKWIKTEKESFKKKPVLTPLKNGGPVMYGDGTKVYSTFDQSTNQIGNNYANNITGASTNIDPNGNTSQQFVRQTTNPNQTPYMRYFNDDVLGSEMHIAGANGNNMFFKPDPMMDNFLKTRTNYMSGAMAGEQMKKNGGTVDALQLMGMPTPPMYGAGSFTGNPYNRFGRRGRNTGDDHITGFSTGFVNDYNLPQGYSSSGQSANVSQAATPKIGIGTRINGLDYTKDFYNDNNISLGAGLSLGRAQQDRGSLFKTFNYTTPHGTPGTGFTQVAGPESKTFMIGDLHGNVDAHVPLFNASWGAQRQGHRNVGPGNVEVAGLNASLEGGLSKFGSGKINPYYDASVGLGMLNNTFNINAGYTNRTGNLQVGLPGGSTAVDTQKGRPYIDVGAQAPLWIDNKGNTRLKVFGGWGSGPQDAGYAGATYTFANGGHVTNYSPSSNFGTVQSMNNTYMHGYANGGPVGMYGFGSTIKDLGYGMADSSLGTIGSLTGIKSMQDIVDEDQYSNDKFDDVANFAGKVGGTAIKFIPGVGQVVGAVGAGAGALANTAFKIDEKNYDPSKHTSNWDKVGNFVEGAGNIASSFVNPMGAADTLSKGAQTAMNVGKIAGLGATGINAARDIDKSRGGTYDPTNLLNLGMGVANSGFFGGNMNTTSNYTGNTKGAVDYTPTMDTPLYAAMGGAVNAPNMMKYAQGGGVDMTEINVEHNELLTDENGKILTEYSSNALPPHPADGSMDKKGTVPAPPGAFVVTAALADKYKAAMKNNDKLHADAMRNNIAFDKQRKEAKQQAKQQAQQQMMQDMMVAKFGGMVRGYGYGGGVMKYDGGSRIPPIDESMAGAPGYYNYNSLSPIFGPGYNDPNADEYTGLDLINNMGFMPTGAERAMQAARNYNFNDVYGTPIPPTRVPLTPPKLFPGDPGYNERTDTPYRETIPTGGSTGDNFDEGNGSLDDLNKMNSSSPETWNAYARAQNNPSMYDYTSTSALGYKDSSTPPGMDPNYFKYQRMLSYGAPGLLGLEALLSKPFNMNAADYQIKGKVDPYEEEYIPDYRPYNAAVANLNRMPGSGNLAARTNLFNAMQQQQDDARYKISLANAQRKMAAQQANLGIEGQNLSTAMNIAQFNEQNKAARRNAIREQFGKNLPAVAYNDMANQMAMAGMSAAYPTYPFPWNKKST